MVDEFLESRMEFGMTVRKRKTKVLFGHTRPTHKFSKLLALFFLFRFFLNSRTMCAI